MRGSARAVGFDLVGEQRRALSPKSSQRAVVEAHNYQYETSALYLAIFVVLAVTGSGSLSIASLYRNALPDWAKAWV